MNYVIYKNKKYFPSKVICVGLNYIDHAKELNHNLSEEPVIFIKPNSAISQTLESQDYDGFHYEAEISFLIENSKIFAVGFGLDITKRNEQNNLMMRAHPWERSKAFDKSAVFSEFVDFNGSFNDITLKLIINGSIVQSCKASSMIFSPDELMENIKKDISFENGDILMTGTPDGVGNFSSGDIFNCQLLDKNKLLIVQNYKVKKYEDRN